MNARHIGKPVLSEEQKNYLLALTDAEIDAAIAEDEDSYILSDEELAEAVMVSPTQEALLIPLEKDTLRWLKEHDIAYIPMVQKMLSAFVEAHEKDR